MREIGRKTLLHLLKRRRDHCGSDGPVFLHAAVFCRIEWWADLLRKGEISWITFTIMGDPAAAQAHPALKESLVPPDQREPPAAPVPRGRRVRPALKGSLVPPDQREPLAAPAPRGSRACPAPKGSLVPPDRREPLAAPAPRGSRVRPALKGSLVSPDQREPLAAPASRGSKVRPVPKESQVPPDQREPPAPQERFPQTAPRPSTPFRPSSLPGRALTCFPARRIQQGISPSPALSRWDWRQGIIWCPTRCPPP